MTEEDENGFAWVINAIEVPKAPEIEIQTLSDVRNDDGEIEWEETWDTDEHDGLPLAIQMKIEWQDGTTQYWLRRQAGTSYNTELLPGT